MSVSAQQQSIAQPAKHETAQETLAAARRYGGCLAARLEMRPNELTNGRIV